MPDSPPNTEDSALSATANTAAEPDVHLESYLRVRDLLEAAPYAILEVDEDGRVVLLNAAAEVIFGYSREDLLGQSVDVLLPQPMRQRHNEHRERYSEHPITRPMGIGLELFGRRKSGVEFPVEISLSGQPVIHASALPETLRMVRALQLSRNAPICLRAS